MTACIFLDRDGTINRSAPPGQYVTAPEQFEFRPGVLDALAFLAKNSEKRVVIVTNQSAIGRGLATQGQVDDLHDWMERQVVQAGGRIDEIYVCPHAPGDGCDCRKPQPGLLLQAERDLGVDLAASCLVGDTEFDLQAAWAAGVPECYLLYSATHFPDPWRGRRYLVVDSLAQAACRIVQRERSARDE